MQSGVGNGCGTRSRTRSRTRATHGPDTRFAELRRTGDRRIRNALVEDHRWLAVSCARRFEGKGEPAEDLRQVAVVGLVKAIDRFDPDHGCSFSTYAVPTIVGELRRHFRDHTWGMRVPRRAKEHYLAVKNVADELPHVLGRSPTVAELADRAGLTVDEVLEALDVGNAYRGVPLDSGGEGDDDPGAGAGAGPRCLGVDEPGYALAEIRTVLPGLLAALPSDDDRRMIELRFVDGLSQSRIGARLGVSQVHVSRRLRHSLAAMREMLPA